MSIPLQTIDNITRAHSRNEDRLTVLTTLCNLLSVARHHESLNRHSTNPGCTLLTDCSGVDTPEFWSGLGRLLEDVVQDEKQIRAEADVLYQLTRDGAQ